ncbi:MAG: family 10 glycosylhydrolase [Candidatus Omnitrophota bacterium]
MRKIIAIILLIPVFLYSAGISLAQEEEPRLGVWIPVFSPEKVLYSKKNVDQLITTCKKTGISDIYIQVYRADKAYYNSALTDRNAYEKMLSESQEDALKYLISKAKKNNISVHAWMNLLSIAKNKNANVVKKFGEDVITIDQHGRTSMQGAKKDKLDSYYIREHQLFLEPGDERVRNYLTNIAEEIVKKYPGLSGLHLDYIRYPSIVPFTPGSRFNSHGISYGYTRTNIKNFQESTGLNAKTMQYSRQNFKKWDTWRRDQVTLLVKSISDRVRAVSPDLEISCTIVPSMERTYLVTFQDWTRWLEEDIVDYVVAMNYTDDTRLLTLNAKSLLLPGLDKKVYMGVGAYLLEDIPEVLEAEIDTLRELSPGGIVVFSYDDIAKNESLQKFLTERFMPQEKTDQNPAQPLSSSGS